MSALGYPRCDLRTRREVELGEDVRNVTGHRRPADPQASCDSGIGESFSDQLRHFQLAARKRFLVDARFWQRSQAPDPRGSWRWHTHYGNADTLPMVVGIEGAGRP